MQRMQVHNASNRVVALFAVALGAIVLGAALIAGQPVLGVFMFAILGAFGGFMGFGRSEFASIYRETGDERERSINDEAARFSYGVVCVVAVIGFVVEIARGNDSGPFTFISFVAGASYLAAIAVLKRRR